MDTWTSANLIGLALSSMAGEANAVEVGCRVELPTWWPARTTIGGPQGSIWRPIYLLFDTHSRHWQMYSSRDLLQWNDPRIWDRLTREQTVYLNGTSDQLVVQHKSLAPLPGSGSQERRIHFQRLARRNVSSGELLWETLESGFQPAEPLEQLDISFQLLLPCFPLESGSTWCLIGQNLSGNRLPMVMKYWRLDLKSGSVDEVIPEFSPAGWNCEIVSDGQSLVLRDPTTQKLLEWRPDHSSRIIGGTELSNSDQIGMLSGRRILCIEQGDDDKVIIRVVTLDTNEVQQVFP